MRTLNTSEPPGGNTRSASPSMRNHSGGAGANGETLALTRAERPSWLLTVNATSAARSASRVIALVVVVIENALATVRSRSR